MLRLQLPVGALRRFLWSATRMPGLLWITSPPHARGRAQEESTGHRQGWRIVQRRGLTAGREAGRPVLVCKASLKQSLKKLCDQAAIQLQMEEWDILRSPSHDLSDPQIVEALLSRIRQGEFDAIFMSPPCNTWSRAPHSNPWGPCSLRNKSWPRGFPCLKGRFKEHAHLGNLLVDVCFTICNIVCNDQRCARVKIIWEHPEDLGAAWDSKGYQVFPASIWQLAEMQELFCQPSWITVAFFQCQFCVNRLKPTRLLSNIAEVATFGFLGLPTFDSDGWYVGPLPQTCPHGGHPALIKRSQHEDFRTTGTGVYPTVLSRGWQRSG